MGLVLTLLIAGVYVASGWWWVSGSRSIAGHGVFIGVGGGCLLLSEFDAASRMPMPLDWEAGRYTDSMLWWFQVIRAPIFGNVLTYVMIPLWAPLLLIAIPMYFLWPRPFRRHRPGHCRACGYDLKGVPTSTCPECGKGAA
jgi:hypothetical protein